MVLSTLSLSSHAGILIEPYLGFGLGMSGDHTSTVSGNSNVFDSDPGSAVEFGGRVGYTFMGFFGALNYSMTSFDIDDKPTKIAGVSSSSYATNTISMDQNAFGVTVGYKLPILLRFWGTYHFNVSWDSDADRVADNTTNYKTESSGNGFSLGAGWTGLPFITVYAEYSSVTIDTLDKATNSGGTDVSGNFSSYERTRNSLIIGVSAPFDI